MGTKKLILVPMGTKVPKMGTKVGAVQVDAIINLGYFKKDPSPVAAGQRHFLC